MYSVHTRRKILATKKREGLTFIEAGKRGSGLKSPDKIFRNLFPIVKRHFETPLDIHS